MNDIPTLARMNHAQGLQLSGAMALVAQAITRRMAAIADDMRLPYSAMQIGTLPTASAVYTNPASKTDIHVMPLSQLPAYRMWGALEVPQDAARRIDDWRNRLYAHETPAFDELYIAVEVDTGAPLTAYSGMAPAKPGLEAWPYKVEFNRYQFRRITRPDERARLDPLLIGVVHGRYMGATDCVLCGMVEIARWMW